MILNLLKYNQEQTFTTIQLLQLSLKYMTLFQEYSKPQSLLDIILKQIEQKMQASQSSINSEKFDGEYNFLEDIKGHLEENSYETQLHDIYEVDEDSAEQDQIIIVPKVLIDMHPEEQNMLYSINQFCSQYQGVVISPPTKRLPWRTQHSKDVSAFLELELIYQKIRI